MWKTSDDALVFILNAKTTFLNIRLSSFVLNHSDMINASPNYFSTNDLLTATNCILQAKEKITPFEILLNARNESKFRI